MRSNRLKIIVTGRRCANKTWADMKSHMLRIHGPLVVRDAHHYLHRYVQNQVIDAAYGALAPFGRDMVAEVTIAGEGPPPAKSKAILDDEPLFAHQTDLFIMMAQEEVIMEPPIPSGPEESARGFKALYYLAPPASCTAEVFLSRWSSLDPAVLQLGGLIGYVRSSARKSSLPVVPYAGVAGLWFKPGTEKAGLTTWNSLLRGAGLIDDEVSFCLHVEEHQIFAAPLAS